MDGSEEAKANLSLPGCAAYRDSAPGVIFAHESGRFYRVEDTFRAIYQGNQIAVGQLGHGSVATVTLGPGKTVIRIEVTSLSVQKAANLSVPVSVQPSLAVNGTCDVCRINQATFFCNCKIPYARLCSPLCFLSHQWKNTLFPHSVLHLSVLRGAVLPSHCQRCNQTYADDYFPQFPICGCRLCALCQAGMLQSGRQVCLCGTSFAQHSTDIVNSMKCKCIVCGTTGKLMTEFTSVRCSDHIVCLKCLNAVMKDPEPRCPVDYRQFAQYEIEAAMPMLNRQCELYCGDYFPSSEALPLDCGCHYCERCTRYEVKKFLQLSQPFDKCFVCGSPFPKAIVDMYADVVKQPEFMSYTLKVTIQGLGNCQAPNCVICMARIGRLQKLTLTCGHSFHKYCLADQAEAHTDAIVKHEIRCVECQHPIDGDILEQLMKPQLFHKYCVKLIEAQNLLVYCPHCNTPYIADPLMIKQAPVGCQKCGFQFCTLCQGQWTTHDIARCQFDEIQMKIKLLEQIMGPNEMIAQCPTCKTPYLMNIHYGEHKKCCTPGCPDWCSCCSSLWRPIVSHSTHWHRPDCKYVRTEDISEEPMSKDCPECMRLGRRCDPPPRLKVRRVLDRPKPP